MMLKHSFIPVHTSTHLLSPWLPDPKQKPSSRVSTVLPLSTQALLRAEHLSSDVSTTLRLSPLPELACVLAAWRASGAALGPPAPACPDTLVSLQVARAEPSKHNAASHVSCSDTGSSSQPWDPKSSATRELNKEPENIASGNHILKEGNSRFTSNGVKRNVIHAREEYSLVMDLSLKLKHVSHVISV